MRRRQSPLSYEVKVIPAAGPTIEQLGRVLSARDAPTDIYM